MHGAGRGEGGPEMQAAIASPLRKHSNERRSCISLLFFTELPLLRPRRDSLPLSLPHTHERGKRTGEQRERARERVDRHATPESGVGARVGEELPSCRDRGSPQRPGWGVRGRGECMFECIKWCGARAMQQRRGSSGGCPRVEEEASSTFCLRPVRHRSTKKSDNKSHEKHRNKNAAAGRTRKQASKHTRTRSRGQTTRSRTDRDPNNTITDGSDLRFPFGRPPLALGKGRRACLRAHTHGRTHCTRHTNTREPKQTISHKHPNNRTQTRGNSNKHKLAITNARKPAFAHKHLHTNMHTRTNTNTNTQIQTQTVTLSGYKNLLP